MAVIQDIPNEILDEILSYLSGNDLAATSRVMRRFHAATKSPLYRAPILLDLSKSLLWTPPPIKLLLRTLLLAPDRKSLASRVRSISVELIDYELAPPTNATDIALLTTAAVQLGLYDQLLDSSCGQLVLLLNLLPRLDHLDIWPKGCWCFQDFCYVLRDSSKLPVALRCIRQVSSHFSSYGIDLVGFGKALYCLRGSLEYLDIDFSATYPLAPGYGDDDSDNEACDFLDSLREWAALRTLKCPLMVLLGRTRNPHSPSLADVLPPGLHSLTIYADDCWLAGQVVDKLVGLLVTPLMLREVAVQNDRMPGVTVEMQQRLFSACKAAGLPPAFITSSPW